MSKLSYWARYAVWRACYEVWAYPYYVMLIIVFLLWIGEGVAEQSGWISCPTPQ